ncbi:MAG TPA: GumC family protein, partial [Vicinamibacterales bacterium]|nr:GumC family protein [Vicinamibacterales bacterium]
MKDASLSEPLGLTGYPRTGLPAAAGAEADVREMLRRLARRKWTILGITALLTLAAAVVTFQLTPRYRAETQVMIESRQQRVVDVEEVLSGLSGERETIESERRVIASRALAEKVIARLKLSRDPEFNPALREPHPLLRLLNPLTYLPPEQELLEWLPEPWRDLVRLTSLEAPKTPEEILEAERARVVDTFLDRLDVLPDGRSRVITIAFTSEQPELAARVANTLAELYLVEQLEAKYEATRLATEWLNDRTAELRDKVKASEDAVEAFRRQAGLIEGKGVTLASQQVAELNTQLILARTARAEAEARLRQVQSLLGGAGGVDSAAEVLSSPLIVRLKEQEAEIMRRAAELATQYGPKHPRMINIQAELEDIKGKIGFEVQKIVQSLRNEAGVARAREASLSASLEALKENAGRANGAEVRLRALEREASANRALFETFLARLKETTAQQDLHQPDARIISRADVPENPAFPRKKLILAGVLLAALIVAIAVAFLLERLDPGFRSSEQIETMLGVPGLGLIPLLTGLRVVGRNPESYV